MKRTETINILLDEACPSIKYRIREELLGQSAQAEEMKVLQGDILRDNLVHRVLSWWESSGWSERSFHGREGIEAGVRILREKGLHSQHPAIRSALQILENEPDILASGIGKPGKFLDDLGLGGSKMIRAVIFAHAGKEKHPCVVPEIKTALHGFETLLSVESLEEITERRKGKLVFKQGVKWPSIYHLRLLAFTTGWRTLENRRLIVGAMQRLVNLSPLPQIYAYLNSQLIAPASFGMLDFNPNMQLMSTASWMMWFQRMELLARVGVISFVPELASQLQQLKQILESGSGWFGKKIRHAYFRDWGVYTGLQLEEDWRSSRRRVFDLTFRSLLICHYANQR